MSKIALVVLLVIVLVCWLRYKAAGRSGAADAARAPVQRSHVMVACAKCGVYLPDNEAVVGGSGKTYCDAQHRAQAQDAPP